MSDTTSSESFKSQQDTQGSFTCIVSVPTLTTMTAVAILNPADFNKIISEHISSLRGIHTCASEDRFLDKETNLINFTT